MIIFLVGVTSSYAKKLQINSWRYNCLHFVNLLVLSCILRACETLIHIIDIQSLFFIIAKEVLSDFDVIIEKRIKHFFLCNKGFRLPIKLTVCSATNYIFYALSLTKYNTQYASLY